MTRALLLASIALLAACGGAAAPAACPKPASASVGAPADDRMVEIGQGLSLHVHCMGSGAPTVLFEAGAGTSGTAWQLVQPKIAETSRACVYDRAGAGYSTTPPRPRAMADVVRELHALLGKAEIAPPYVLVGHSLGGLYARLYAVDHPDEVVGMVLVDASSEDQDQKLWSLLPADALQDDPRNREGIGFAAEKAGMAQLRAANRSLGDKPLIVLTAGESGPEPGVGPELAARVDRAWHEMQDELPKLSTSSAQVVATKSHHFIQLEAPELVIAAVREVVLAVREHRKIDAAPLRALVPAKENEPPPAATPAASLDPKLAPFAFLLGEWVADPTPDSAGKSWFEVAAQGRAIVRRNESTSARGRHDDTMTIYVEGDAVRALYVDNEGHVIRYTAGPGAALVTDKTQPGPGFRLTYAPAEGGAVAGTFEVAPPGGAAFKPYLTWRMHHPN